MQGCPSGNVLFLDEQEAWAAALEIERRTAVPIEVVACAQCPYWHAVAVRRVRAIDNTR